MHSSRSNDAVIRVYDAAGNVIETHEQVARTKRAKFARITLHFTLLKTIQEDREMASTKDVLEHHLKCFGEGDLGGILSDYAPSAVMFTADRSLRGIDAIRPLFQAMLVEFGKPGATFTMRQQLVDGDYAYILWSAETADNVYELGTDTFVVRDGKIMAQSFTGKITPKG